MNKKQKLHITFILMMAFFYAVCVFIKWDFNASNWGVEWRVMYGVFAPAFSAIVAAIPNSMK